MLRSIILAVATVTLSMGYGQAKTVKYETHGMEIFHLEVPDQWNVHPGHTVDAAEMPDGVAPAPRIISAENPDENEQLLWSGFWSPADVIRLEDAGEYLESLAPNILANHETLISEDMEISGHATKFYSGVGEVGEMVVDFAVAVVEVSADRLAIAAFIAEPDAFDRNHEILSQVMRSIRAPEGN